MFCGLIEEIGTIEKFSNSELIIKAQNILELVQIGDSIAVNGVCLSITKLYKNKISFYVSSTTQNITRFNHSKIKIHEKVNLERALRYQDFVGGHLISGHVDGIGKIINIKSKNKEQDIEVLCPTPLMKFIATKGSIAIDGISLTIKEVLSSSFVITVIPITLEKTNLQYKKIGDAIHIETDLISKYVHKHLIFLNNEKGY